MHLTRLRAARNLAFLTQRELAAKAGLTQATIARLESGRQAARPTTARRLAEALYVEPRELIADRTEGAAK